MFQLLIFNFNLKYSKFLSGVQSLAILRLCFPEGLIVIKNLKFVFTHEFISLQMGLSDFIWSMYI